MGYNFSLTNEHILAIFYICPSSVLRVYSYFEKIIHIPLYFHDVSPLPYLVADTFFAPNSRTQHTKQDKIRYMSRLIKP